MFGTFATLYVPHVHLLGNPMLLSLTDLLPMSKNEVRHSIDSTLTGNWHMHLACCIDVLLPHLSLFQFLNWNGIQQVNGKL